MNWPWLWVPLIAVGVVIGHLFWLSEVEIEREKLVERFRKELYEVRDEILNEIREYRATND